MLKKVGTDNRLLKTSDVENGGSIDKVCYVVDVKSGVSKLEQGFYTIFVKTIDGVVLPSFIFNIADFIDAGFDIYYLKGKLINIIGNANVMNKSNSMSIIIKDIKVVTAGQEGVDESTYGSFLGRVENVNDLYDEATRFLGGRHIPKLYTYKSFSGISNNEVGGYIKFIWQLCISVNIICDLHKINLSEVLYDVILNYGEYLEQCSTIEVVPVATKLNLVNAISVSNENEYVVKDTLAAIYGLSKPEHLHANIIYNVFCQVHTTQKMMNSWKTLPKGGAVELEEFILRKY